MATYTHAIYLTEAEVQRLRRRTKRLKEALDEFLNSEYGTEEEAQALCYLEAKEAAAASRFENLVRRIEEA